MENNNVSKIIIGFFMIIVGLVLIASVANSSAAITSKTDVISELISIADARNDSGLNFTLNYSVDITIDSDNIPTSWKITECPISSFSLTNQSGEAMVAATDYDFTASTGVLNFYNTEIANMSGHSNDTYGTYTYCPDAYLNIAWGRSVMNLIAGFFALAILGLGLGIFYSVAKDNGII